MNNNLLESFKNFCYECIGELINSCQISIESSQIEENQEQKNSLFAAIYSSDSTFNQLLTHEAELERIAKKMGLNFILIIPDTPNNLDYFFNHI